MRYAITHATRQQVSDAGATSIKEAPRTKIIFAELTSEQASRLHSLGCKVDRVGRVKAAVMPPAPVAAAPTYSLEQLVWAAGFEDLRGITSPPLYGSGIAIAILDSGIRETHEKIGGRVVYSENYTSDPMRDGFDHGTGVCSIIVSVAPLCNILNMKVLDDNGEGTEEEVILAIDDCIGLHDSEPEMAPRVINISLGAPDTGDPDEPIRIACRAAIEAGIWVSAAAGNGGPEPNTIMSPACEKYVFATGSIRYEPFSVSTWSSRGPTEEGLTKPDAVFFGEDIVVASSVSDSATVAKSGTSFSTPFSSGVAVLYQEGVIRYGGVGYPEEIPPGIHPELTRLLSMEELMDTYLQGICVKPQGLPAWKDNDIGYGMPFGSLLAQAIGVRPAVDITAMIGPIIMITMMGMVIKIA